MYAGEKKKLQGFTDYLRGRGKAAVVQVNEGRTLYLVPNDITSTADSAEPTVIVAERIERQGSFHPPTAVESSEILLPGSSSSLPLPPPVPKVVTIEEVHPSMDNEDSNLNVLPPMVWSTTDQLRSQVQERLRAFVNDSTATSLPFPPMDSIGRYLVIDEASEFPELIDEEKGEMIDERYVIVYKPGHAPVDDPRLAPPEPPPNVPAPSGSPGKARATAESASGRTAGQRGRNWGGAGSVGAVDLVTLNTKKRDRRTIEQIMKDMHGKKLRQ